MTVRIVNPNRFVLLGAVTDWRWIFGRRDHRTGNPDEIASQRGLAQPRLAQLRWVLDPKLG
jgi:hypothetical protein